MLPETLQRLSGLLETQTPKAPPAGAPHSLSLLLVILCPQAWHRRRGGPTDPKLTLTGLKAELGGRREQLHWVRVSTGP